MKFLSASFGGLCAALGLMLPAAAETELGLNQTAYVNGVETSCAGAGFDEQVQAQGALYPVTFKHVGAYGQWLGHEDLAVTGSDRHRVSVHCQGPWVQMYLAPGRYIVQSVVPGARMKEIGFVVGNRAREVVIRFPEQMERNAPANSADWSSAYPDDELSPSGELEPGEGY